MRTRAIWESVPPRGTIRTPFTPANSNRRRKVGTNIHLSRCWINSQHVFGWCIYQKGWFGLMGSALVLLTSAPVQGWFVMVFFLGSWLLKRDGGGYTPPKGLGAWNHENSP